MHNYSKGRSLPSLVAPRCADLSPGGLLTNDLTAPEPGPSCTHRDRGPTRLIAAVAQLYHQERCTQKQIAQQLRLSQGTVCRLLQKAEEMGIVRITVIPPLGTFVDLEELLEHKFGLDQVIVARAASDSEETVQSALGLATAHFLETTLKPREVIGMTAWSATLHSMVEQMRPIWKIDDCQVVQILGDLGNPSTEKQAHHLVRELASLVQGRAHFLAAPGIVNSQAAAEVLAQDRQVRETQALFDRITVALVEIGPIETSSWLAASDHSSWAKELQALEEKGAVGSICLRFYDICGKEIADRAGGRVFGLGWAQLKNIPRVVGIGGGQRKHQAMLGALRGRLVNIMITDQFSAQALVHA